MFELKSVLTIIFILSAVSSDLRADSIDSASAKLELTKFTWCRAWGWDVPPEEAKNATPLGSLDALKFYENGKFLKKSFSVADLGDRWVFADALGLTVFVGEWHFKNNQIAYDYRLEYSRSNAFWLADKQFNVVADYHQASIVVDGKEYLKCDKLTNKLEQNDYDTWILGNWKKMGYKSTTKKSGEK